ncbi:MAG TPA: hypothetical protein VK741_13115 [Acetobacteraceae bacterium]|jgi:hypothetical protein|nr:hypothetical protein [Acetobacteraceae bacterium]
MLTGLIEKIASQTGQPVETVTPIVGALLAHLGDVLPAPLAHEIAIILGIHQDDNAVDTAAQPTNRGILGSLAESLTGNGGETGGSFAGASSLMNAAQTLLGGYLAGKR